MLRIIGVILLTILGMVLFIPVRYRVHAKTKDGLQNLEVDLEAYWLLHLFSARYRYRNQKSEGSLKIGWKQVGKKKQRQKQKRQSEHSEQKKQKKYTVSEICDKIKSVFQEKDNLEILKFAKMLRPRRLRGYVIFGFEDPYHTGQVLAFLAILYPFYGDRVTITPDFEQKILEGDLEAKGHVYTVTFATFVWNVFIKNKIKESKEYGREQI